MKLFYRETGQGYPLIILHGLYGSSDNWMSIARQLSNSYRVIIPDQRNHGNSPHSEVHDYDSMAEDLYELISELDIDNFVLAGHSMGGKTAAYFARKYPHFLDGLIILDIHPFSYSTGKHSSGNMHRNILEWMNATDPSQLESREFADKIMSEIVPSERIRSFLLKNLKRDQSGKFTWKLNPENLLANLDNIMDGFSEEDQEQVSGFPVIFVKGGNSDYIDESDEERILKVFPAAELIEIKGASHWLHAEKPAELIDIIRDSFETL